MTNKTIRIFLLTTSFLLLTILWVGCGGMSKSPEVSTPEAPSLDTPEVPDEVLEYDESAVSESYLGDDREDGEESEEDVTVTGSRIGRDNLEDYAQITVIESEEVRESTFSSKVPASGTKQKKRYRPLKKQNYNAQYQAAKNLGVDLGGADELWVIARRDDFDPNQQKKMASEPPALRAILPNEPKTIPLPLEHTEVRAAVHAYIASVEVEQRYHNPYDEKIEVVYVFPLPQNSAVSEFLMKIGDRTIRGIIRERKQAEKIYREARNAGYTASLLTQERPNVFTQKVANIEPKKDIDIQLTYYNTLPFKDGSYVFTFPTVVGPRFNPPGSTDGIGSTAHGATGSSGQSTEVQYLKPGQKSGHDFSMTIDLEAGMTIDRVDSPSHDISVEKVSNSRRTITLVDGVDTPNKDFVLRYKVAGDNVKSTFLAHENGKNGYFTMLLTPPEDQKYMKRAPMEHVFVLDCSGSMNGWPLDTAKAAVERVLNKLDERDSFQIIQFSSNASKLGRRPVQATRSNIKDGLRYLRRLRGQGGTMMIEGIKAALDFPHDREKVRVVTFMTDGYIGNEAEILAAIHKKLGHSKIFSFGVGTSPNRYLLERMAKLGQGAVAYIGEGGNREDRKAVDAFFERISHPAFSDIKLDFGDMEVSEVYPSRIPDLWAGRPVVITGRYTGFATNKVTVKGRIGGRPYKMKVAVNDNKQRKRPAIRQVWARMKIMDMVDHGSWHMSPEELKSRVKNLALSYSLMSKFTAFVAVDSSRKTEGHHGFTVVQPVPVPKGVRYDTTVSE